MLISSDWFRVPLDEKYFRVAPENLVFTCGGAMSCVGMVTNIIGENTNQNNENNVFATIQFSVNEVIRSILPTHKKKLYVIHPIAVYYNA